MKITIKQQKIKFNLVLISLVLILFTIAASSSVLAAEKDYGQVKINNKINLNGVSLKEAFSSLAEMADLNLITDDSSVNGTVTARLKNISAFKAIKLLVRSHGLDYKIIEDTIIIGTAEKLIAGFGEKVTKVYKLNNADAEKVKSNLSLLLGTEKIQINQRNNQLLIKTYKSKLPEIETAIQELDQPRKQVVIQVRLEEISKGDLDELGIDWNFGDLKFDTDGNSGQTDDNSEDDGDDNQSSSIDIGSASLDYSSVLNLLAQSNQSSTLANPRLTAVDGEQATINIGESIPIVKESDENTEVEFKDVGINLEITPRITGEEEVYINVKPEVSVVKEYLQAANTKYPVIGTRKAETSVRVKQGQTIAIGGLIKEEEVEKLSKIPLLGDVPILGKLFQNKTNDNQKQELVIFLTIQIIDSKEDNAANDIIPTKYTIKKKDTLLQISQWFNVPFYEIIRYNDSELIQSLENGTQLKIPVPYSHYYAVESSDTLKQIADKYNIKVSIIKRINNLETLENRDSLILPVEVDLKDGIKR